MSTTIDSKVVEMRFDNKHFESNVSTTMSTLDKLKQKLHFGDSSKGLENLSKSVKQVDMQPLANGIDTVKAKFSAMDIMATTALVNITNSAVNAGKRIVSALTIDPIKTGLQEYETQINAVQTILANTQSKGTTLDDVNKALDELNEYADLTIYNFTEMTRNIGTFTAAGVGLKESVSSIKGIANLAAISGASSEKASVAMYQLSQALATGTVKLMDWNSVVNAGMGGEVFQNAIKDTARTHGVAVDSIIEKNGSFRDSLHDGWLTADILNETLEKFTVTTEGLTDAQIENLKATWKAKGYTEEQIEEIFKLGNTATDAATKVKTFSQMWGVLKETAQSGWAQTWEIIFGDFEEAKALFTPLTNFFTGIIQGISNFRNTLLRGAMSSPLGQLAEKIKNVTTTVDSAVNKIKDYGDVVNRIINGEFGNGESRFKKLTEAGYDWAHAQNLVNEKLGDSTRHATDYKEATEELTETVKELSDEELRNIGLTEEEIKMYRELEKQSKETGLSISQIIENMDQMDGRTMLINSFKNAGTGLYKTFKALKDAWIEIFPPMTSLQLYNAIASFHEFSKKLAMSDETADKLKRTLKGVFAILDIVLTIVGGPIKFAFKALCKILGAFDLDILDVTASIGDWLVKTRDMVDACFNLSNILNGLAKAASWVSTVIKDIFGIEVFDFGPGIQKMVQSIKDYFNELRQSDNIALDIITGLINGIKSGLSKVGAVMKEFGLMILNTVKDILGIHSPARKFIEIAEMIVMGLVEGLKKFWYMVTDFFGGIDWGAIVTIGMGAGFIALAIKLSDFLSAIAGPLDGLGDMMEGVGKGMKNLGKGFKDAGKGMKNYFNAMALKNLAVAIAVLAASLFVLSKIPENELKRAAMALVAVTVVLVALMLALSKLAKVEEGVKSGTATIAAMSVMLVTLSTTLITMALVAKILGGMKPEAFIQGMAAIVILGVMITTLIKATVHSGSAKQIAAAAALLLTVSNAIAMMAIIATLLGYVNFGKFVKGVACIALLEALIVGLIASTKLAGGDPKTLLAASAMILVVTNCITMLSALCVVLGLVSPKILARGIVAIAALEGIIIGLMAATKLVGGKSTELLAATAMIMAVSTAMVLLGALSAILSLVDIGQFAKGTVMLAALGAMIIAFIKCMKKLDNINLNKVAISMMTLSIAIGILGGVAVLLGYVDQKKLWNGVGVVAVLSLIFGGLMALSWATTEQFKSLIAMVSAVAVLAIAVAGLSAIDPERLKIATTCISALMLSLGTMIALTKYMSEFKFEKSNMSVAPFVALGGILVATIAALAVMSKLPPDGLVASALALTIVANGIVPLFKVLGSAAKNIYGVDFTSMATVIGSLVVVLAAIMGVLAILSHMPPDGLVCASLAVAIVSVGIVPLVMTLGMLGETLNSVKIGPMAVIIGTLGVVLAAIMGVLVVLSKMPPDGLVAASLAVAIVSDGLVPLLLALGIIAGIRLPLGALTKTMIDLTGVVVILAGVLVAFGALMAIEGLKELVHGGGELLAEVFGAIGKIIGECIGSFGEALTESMVVMAENLSSFAEKLQPFLQAMTAIDPKSLEGAGRLVEIILLLTGASLINQITDFLDFFSFGDSPMEKLAEQLVTFGYAMVTFSRIVSGKIDREAVEACASAGNMLANLCKELPRSGGLLDGILGDKDIDKWGAKLVPFGQAMVAFSREVQGKIDVAAVEACAYCAEMMVALNKEIPNDTKGTLMGVISGDKNIDSWGAKLPVFGKHMVAFSRIVAGKIDLGAVESVKAAGDMMVALNKEIPTETKGTLIGFVKGNNNIEDWGNKVRWFGRSMVDFSTTVAGKIDISAVESAKAAGDIMVALAREIPKTGGFFSWFTGDNDLGDFADNIVEFGEGMVEFSKTISGVVDTEKTNALANLVWALKDLEAVTNFDLSAVGPQLQSLGDHLKMFFTKCTEIITDKQLEDLASIMDSLRDLAGTEFKNSVGMSSLIYQLIELTKIDTSSLEQKDDDIRTFVENVKTKIAEIGNEDILRMNSLATCLGNISNIATWNSEGFTSVTDALGRLSEVDTEKLSAVKTKIDELLGDGGGYKGYSPEAGGEFTALGSGLAGLASISPDLATVGTDLYTLSDGLTSLGDIAEGPLATIGTTLSTLGSNVASFIGYVNGNLTEENLQPIERLKWFFESLTGLTGYKDESGWVNDDGPITAIKEIATALQTLASIDISSSSLFDFAMDDDDPTANSKLEKLGSALSSFYGQIKDITDIGKLGDLISNINWLNEINGKWTSSDAMEQDIKDLAKAIAEFNNNKIDESTANNLKTAVDAIFKFTEVDENGNHTINTDFASAGTAAVKAFTDAIGSEQAKKDISSSVNSLATYVKDAISGVGETGSAWESVGTAMMTQIADGFSTAVNVEEISNNITNGISDFNDKVTGYTEDGTSLTDIYKNIGKSMMQGIVNGFYDESGSEITKTIISNAISRLKTTANEAADINSPSRLFIETGMYMMAGIAKGIDDNVKMGTDSMVAMCEELVKATDEELEINSPSLVFNEKGHYIVQGIAEGIEEDTSAEDAMKQKAQNIVTAFEEAISNTNLARLGNEINHKIWLALNPNASADEILAHNVADATDALKFAESDEKYWNDAWLFVKDRADITEDAKQDIYNKWRQSVLTRIEAANNIATLEKEAVEAAKQAASEIRSSTRDLNDAGWELWQSSYKDASVETRGKAEKAYLKEQIPEYYKERDYWIEEYNSYVDKTCQEATDAKQNIYDWQVKINEGEERLITIDKETDEARKQALIDKRERQEELEDLENNIAQSEYDLWESTVGRNASDEEKNARKLAYLTEQRANNATLVQLAEEAYLEAVEEFGEGSNEALKAYDEYLEKQKALANTNLEIIGIYEEAEKREQALIDAQKQARVSYDDYIKKYKNYYLKTGMTMEDLERDALLTSGYNPDTAAKQMVKDTGSALENVKNSEEYQNLINGYTEIGTSYVTAVNTGITEEIPKVEESLKGMGTKCIATLRNTVGDWTNAAKFLVQGFCTGIRFSIQNAVNAVTTLGDSVTKALRSSWDIHSPSRVFVNIAKYAVMGLSQGFVDSVYMSDRAATEVGESAVNNLRNSIRYIADAINSDVDVQPTIRPVLDLSDVKDGTKTLDTLFSKSQAVQIENSRAAHRSAEIQNGKDTSNPTGNTYQFTQNNYSPKALSRSEIYRQTKNQFAAMKGALT